MNEDRVAMLKQFVKDEPSNPFNKYALAMEYYESDSPQSLELLSNLLTDHSEYLPTYFKAAHLLWEKGDWDEADEVFQKGIKLAEKQKNQKALQELKAAYLNFEFDRD